MRPVTNTSCTIGWRATRALARRKGLKPERRAQLKENIARVEEEAARRNPTVRLFGWRAYPDGTGNLSFTLDVDIAKALEGTEFIKCIEPERSRKPDPKLAPADGGTLLSQLETSLEMAKNGG